MIEMKKKIVFLTLMITCASSFAHYIWLETAPLGTLNKEHQVKILFGEYTYGVIEKTNGEAFNSASDFELFVLFPDGTKTELEVTAKEDHYLAVFTPTVTGTYTVSLDNKTMEVMDYTKYDFGIFKPQYHAKAKVTVGKGSLPLKQTNNDGIEVIDMTKRAFEKASEVRLKILFQGEPMKENEVSIYISDLWSKKLTTDENGIVTFRLPWDTRYTIETTYNEKVPGTFKNVDYEFIWHCATYCISL